MRLLFEGTCAPGDDHSDVAGSRRTTEGCALMGDQASASEAIFEYYVAQQHKQSAASAEQLSLSGIRMRAVALNPQPLPPENVPHGPPIIIVSRRDRKASRKIKRSQTGGPAMLNPQPLPPCKRKTPCLSQAAL